MLSGRANFKGCSLMPAMLPQVMRENGWSSIFMPLFALFLKGKPG
jgi:hypothetical protein